MLSLGQMRKVPGTLAGDRSSCWAWVRLMPLKYQLQRAGTMVTRQAQPQVPLPHIGQKAPCAHSVPPALAPSAQPLESSGTGQENHLG